MESHAATETFMRYPAAASRSESGSDRAPRLLRHVRTGPSPWSNQAPSEFRARPHQRRSRAALTDRENGMKYMLLLYYEPGGRGRTG